MRLHVHKAVCRWCRTGVECSEAREIQLARARKAEAKRLATMLAKRGSIVRAA